MEENQEKPRAWFRFAYSLRTMFVAITVFGVWLGWQVRIVHERKAIRGEIMRISPTRLYYWAQELDAEDPFMPNCEYARISRIRRFLGDETCILLEIPRSIAPHWIERAEWAFPEAELAIIDPKTRKLYAHRDSLYMPNRQQNTGTIFKTGL